MCLARGGNMVLAIEVKDRDLTLADVRGSTRKARASINPLRNLLFAAPGIRKDERHAVQHSMETVWASG